MCGVHTRSRREERVLCSITCADNEHSSVFERVHAGWHHLGDIMLE